MFYVIGFNLPGYLPEMEPYAVATPDTAKRAMIEELLRDAESAAQYGDEDLATELSEVAEDLNLTNIEEGWGEIIGNTSYWIEAKKGHMTEDVS